MVSGLSCFIRSRVKSVYHRLSLAELPDIPSVPELAKVSTSTSDRFHSVAASQLLYMLYELEHSGSMMSSMVELRLRPLKAQRRSNCNLDVCHCEAAVRRGGRSAVQSRPVPEGRLPRRQHTWASVQCQRR